MNDQTELNNSEERSLYKQEKKSKKKYLGFLIITLVLGFFIMTRDSASSKIESFFQQKPRIKEFTVTIKDSQFTPDNIVVSEGEMVKITAKNLDEQTHGMAIDQFQVWKEIPREGTSTIEFLADKKGTYKFYCSVTCSGHTTMKGNLIVE